MKKLNYSRFGEGNRTIVLLHYFGGNAESWQWVVRKLRKKFSVVVITLPGFGNTKAFDEPSIFAFANYINQCIEDLALENYLLCGHGMSGKLILYAEQIAMKNKAKGLVLIAPSPPTIEKMDQAEKDKMIPKPDRESAESHVENATYKMLRKNRYETAIASQLQVDAGTRHWWLKKGMVDNISERISGIDVPTFVICAKEDAMVPIREIYDSVLPHLHRPRLIQLAKCGHLIPLEAPRRLSKRLVKIGNHILD
ncbi:MAG: alpha/beta hydrolase [Pricia sp.]